MTISERAIAKIARPAALRTTKSSPGVERIECPLCSGEFSRPFVDKSRSLPQHKRFFKVIALAYHHWPETHAEQFASAEECRAWLTMKAGYRVEVGRLPVTKMKPETARALGEALFRLAGMRAAVRVLRDVLVVFKPKSIRFDRMEHMAFNELNERVATLIYAETGIDVEDMLREGNGS